MPFEGYFLNKLLALKEQVAVIANSIHCFGVYNACGIEKNLCKNIQK